MGKRPGAEVRKDQVLRRIDKELRVPTPASKKPYVKDSKRKQKGR